MNNKIVTIIGSTQKKTGAILLCGILALAVCTGTVFAAKPTMLVKVEKGIKIYSTDGGKTWSKKIPEGVTICEAANAESATICTKGLPKQAVPAQELLVKMENGHQTYSVDGGKTWNRKLPEAVTVCQGPDGKTICTNSLPSHVVPAQKTDEDGGEAWATAAAN